MIVTQQLSSRGEVCPYLKGEFTIMNGQRLPHTNRIGILPTFYTTLNDHRCRQRRLTQQYRISFSIYQSSLKKSFMNHCLPILGKSPIFSIILATTSRPVNPTGNGRACDEFGNKDPRRKQYCCLNEASRGQPKKSLDSQAYVNVRTVRYIFH